jgi:hypothetical protein
MPTINISETVNPDHDYHYVSAIDAGRPYIIAGPYGSHAEARENVDAVQSIACDMNGRAHFMAWGTCSAADVIDTPLGAI